MRTIKAEEVPEVGGPRFIKRLRILLATGKAKSAAWLTAAMLREPGCEFSIHHVDHPTDALEALAQRAMDVVILMLDDDEYDSLDLIAGMRGAGHETPVIVVGEEAEQIWGDAACDAGADAYLSLSHTTARRLLWALSQAVERQRLTDENRQLRQLQHHRRDTEQTETRRAIDEQRTALRSPEVESAPDNGQAIRLALGETNCPVEPVAIRDAHRALLKAYVVMGQGHVAEELEAFARTLVDTGLSARRVMRMHLSVVEEMAAGLGARSSRHLLSRADLLALELMLYLAEACQKKAA